MQEKGSKFSIYERSFSKTPMTRFTPEPFCQTTYPLLMESNPNLTLQDPCPACLEHNVRCLIGCHPINAQVKIAKDKVNKKSKHYEDNETVEEKLDKALEEIGHLTELQHELTYNHRDALRQILKQVQIELKRTEQDSDISATQTHSTAANV